MAGMTEKIVEKKNCMDCGREFAVTDRDRAFYEKMKVYGKYEIPDPVECWDCRQRRRQVYRNERNLYADKCDLCGRDMLSIYSSDKPYKVYCSQCWWGDNWDPMKYGRSFDFSQSFFGQLKNLYDEVPKLALIVLGEMQNSDYAHDAYRLKNCYLTFDGEQALDCMYGETFMQIKDCVDFLVGYKSELCYEIVNCSSCYDVDFCKFCKNCSESRFLVDCIGCKNCFACCNLHRKQYCIFNKQYSKEDYEKKVAGYNFGSFWILSEFKKEFEKFVLAQPKRAYHGVQNEDVSGDFIDNCKDVYESFDCVESRDCKFCTNLELKAHDCYDVDIWGDRLERALNCECVGAGANSLMADYYVGLNASNVFYSAFCWNGVSDMLGCCSLKHKKFCIFNKEYSENEYKNLFEKIVSHMQKTGEWGQFFPIFTSSFGYNETVAQEFYPFDEEKALKKGYKWKKKEEREYIQQSYKIPDDIKDVPDSIIDEILACELCGKNFKIVAQELKFYKKKSIHIPHRCYDCRHFDRRKMKNPRRLWERTCAKTGVPILTSYAPGRPEEVWSTEAYQKEFF